MKIYLTFATIYLFAAGCESVSKDEVPYEPTGRSTNPKCNFSNPKQRVNGGWAGIHQFQCESLGYCFDNKIPNVVQCIKSEKRLTSYHCIFENPKKRVAGGPGGISKKDCVQTHNCFDDSIPNTVWCFKQNHFKYCDYTYQESKNRVDAGHPGITKEQCKAAGNCFDSFISTAKFCFKPNRVSDLFLK